MTLSKSDLASVCPDIGEMDTSLVTSLSAAACELSERYMGREIDKIDRTESHVPHGGVIRLRAWPVETVSSVADAESGQAVPYTMDADAGVLYTTHRQRVMVAYTGGYSPVPAPIVLAVASLVQGMVTMSANDGRMLTYERLGDYQVGFATADSEESLARISPAAMALLAAYRGHLG